MMGITASTLHAVLAPGAHRDVSDLVNESLLRCRLAWAARNTWTYCEILGPCLDLRVCWCACCLLLACRLIYYHILRLLLSCCMGVIQWR